MQAAIGWAALVASHAGPLARAIKWPLIAAAIALSVLSIVSVTPPDWLLGLVALVGSALLFIAPLSILRHVGTRSEIDIVTLLGAIDAYLLIGMFFAYVYAALAVLQPGPFYLSGTDGRYADHLFFSFITLTTTGYGNLVPAGKPGQTLAVMEALTGQIFLVTTVGRIVALMQLRRREPAPPIDEN
jgi:hypothetical protein